MDPGTATLLASIIGGVATVGAAIIGYSRGRSTGYHEGKDSGFTLGHEEGMAKGSKHSIERFLDVYRQDIDRAMRLRHGHDSRDMVAAARAIVDNVKTWRRIQSQFSELLNGLVNRLERALEERDMEGVAEALSAISSGYNGKRLAVETELKKSRI